MSSLNIKYLSRLDHLRFIAALLVILTHARIPVYFSSPEFSLSSLFRVKSLIPLWINNAAVGVSLFLCMTGFLFCLITDCGKKEIDYSKFLYNRILRIFPLTMFLVFSIITLTRATSTPMDILRVLTLQFNTGDPRASWGYDIFSSGAIWTIAVEFQFYLIFPFISLFLGKFGIRYLLGLILVILFFKFNITTLVPEGNPENNFYFTLLGRLDQFIVGMVFACLYKRGKTRFLENWIYGIFSLFLSFYILTIIFFVKVPSSSLIHSTTFNIFYNTFHFMIEAIACSLAIVTYLEFKFFKMYTLNKIFSFLGSISFSMYLLNESIIEIINKILYKIVKNGLASYSFIFSGKFYYLAIFPFKITIIILISCLTYYIIEKPFMSLRVKYLKS